MRARRAIVGALCVCAAIAVAAWGWLPRDEARIRATLRELIARCEKSGDGGLLATAARGQEVKGYFTSDAVLRIGPPYPMEVARAEIPALVARAHTYADRIAIRVRGDEVEIESGRRRSAVMRATIEVTVTAGGRDERGIGEYRLEWAREDRAWRIRDVRYDASIRRPGAAAR